NGVRLAYSEADGVTLLVAARRALGRAPARAALGRLLELALVRPGDRGHARVQAQAGDHGIGVAGVGVDRDPLALAALAPAHEAAGVQRRLEQARVMQRVGDGAGAVVAVVLDLG